MKTRTLHEKEIRLMVGRIARRFRPQRIILFGSHSRGNAGSDSDVDLLVIMPFRGSKRKARLAMRRAVHDIQIPKDIFVATPQEFEWRKEIVGTIERPAALEGKVLYASK
jgi:predicted nucleotidyltransferase